MSPPLTLFIRRSKITCDISVSSSKTRRPKPMQCWQPTFLKLGVSKEPGRSTRMTCKSKVSSCVLIELKGAKKKHSHARVAHQSSRRGFDEANPESHPRKNIHRHYIDVSSGGKPQPPTFWAESADWLDSTVVNALVAAFVEGPCPMQAPVPHPW